MNKAQRRRRCIVLTVLLSLLAVCALLLAALHIWHTSRCRKESALLQAEDFESPYYKSLCEGGKVIALGMPVNFSSDEFAEGIVKGLTFLSENDAPFLVHCTEGKDRAGFASMLIEALMGASEEEIVRDYMLSYVNYYGVEEGSEKYDMIAEKNIMEMLRSLAGLEKGASLEGTDLAEAAQAYLLGHGMSAEALEALKTKLG